jgi:transposase
MADASYFIHPKSEWQRRYEALRASYVERLPAHVVADRFGYTSTYIHLLRHQFKHGKIDFSEPPPEGKSKRRRVTNEVRRKIRSWREKRLSAGEISQLLSEEGVEISVRTVERILAEEGFPKLPRRTWIKTGMTVKGTEVPERSHAIHLSNFEGNQFDSPGAGIFLFAPFLAQLRINEIVREAHLPGTKTIPAINYLLSFLALKLLGTERYSHVNDHAFDPGIGLFASLNAIPKCTSMSGYSYSLDQRHITRLQEAFVKQAARIRLYSGKVINMDFHTVPHFGEESVLENHWAGARNKRMKGALTLFAQDAETKLILYTGADIQHSEADEQAMNFLSFWGKVWRGVKPMLVFDSRFMSYAKLFELHQAGIKFITLRRRGKNLIKIAEQIKGWKRIHIPHAKRKYPNPLVHESTVQLKDYDDDLRQVIIKGNGREKPSFMLSNDEKMPVEVLVSNYARRWRVENGIAEAVKFFHLNALSSPILIKVHFDVVMTMIADTLYTMLARKLRGFEECSAEKIHRHFVKGKGTVQVQRSKVIITYPRRAHNPILRSVPWKNLPTKLPWLGNASLVLRFR